MNNNSTQPNNNRRGQLAKPDRAFERVPTRPGYDVLYTRYTKETTQPATPTEPTVVVEEVVTVQQTDIAERIALLLAEAEAMTSTAAPIVVPATPVVPEAPAAEVVEVEEIQPAEEENAPVEIIDPHTAEVKDEVVAESSQSETKSVQDEEPLQDEVVIIKAIPELSDDQKANAITRALIQARKDLDKEHRKKTSLKRFSLGLVGLVLLLTTGYVGLDTWMATSKVKADKVTDVYASPNVVHDQSQEGKDTSPLPANSLKNYQVAPNLPRALYVDKIGIAARLLQMDINSDGSIQAPRNIFDAGWYTSSVKPGENGAVFVDGHSSGSTHQGLFGNLDKLQVGDTMQIEKGDTSRLTYQVVFKETVKLANVDMQKALRVYGGGQKGLNLMTCAGQWTSDNTTMNERVIVYTVQI